MSRNVKKKRRKKKEQQLSITVAPKLVFQTIHSQPNISYVRPKPQDDDATLLKTTSFHTTSKFIYTDCKKSLPLPVSCNLQISFFLFFFRKKKKEKKKDWMNHCMLKWYLCIGTWHLYMPVPFFLVHKFIADHRHSYGQWWASSLPKGPFSWPTMRQESDQTFLGLWRRGKKWERKSLRFTFLRGTFSILQA